MEADLKISPHIYKAAYNSSAGRRSNIVEAMKITLEHLRRFAIARAVQTVDAQTCDRRTRGPNGSFSAASSSVRVPGAGRQLTDASPWTARWWVLTDRTALVRGSGTCTAGVLEVRQLPPGADLKRTLIAAMLEWIDAGWQLGEFSSRSVHFFRSKIVELQTVEASPTDPGIEHYGSSFSSTMDSP